MSPCEKESVAPCGGLGWVAVRGRPRAYARGKKSAAPIGAQENKPRDSRGSARRRSPRQAEAKRQQGPRHFLNPRRG
jgi:hypothetical protein